MLLENAWNFLKYSFVGLGANLIVLGLYFVATFRAGLQPKFAFVVASGVGFLIGYWANRSWTFQASRDGRMFLRYAVGYAGSFLLQWTILLIGVDVLKYPHQWVVLFGLGCATVGFYFAQRHWVFPSRSTGERVPTIPIKGSRAALKIER
jgi:putative flippase GtrA